MNLTTLNPDQSVSFHAFSHLENGPHENRECSTSSHFRLQTVSPRESRVRNDEEILNEVHEAFQNSGFEQLKRIQVYCDHGGLTLQGRISTYYLKQVAQEVARKVPDVRDIDNDLYVVCRS
ncbi:MAG: BON domain-containing protein [Planctomycetes bacterium]|nr:BON domain-containing protein [Planctomycetota bacterium]